ncbi:hypothetical protein [Hahella sp. NBU794]|uniref:hypothetical protein n=1 Tax=Hahella sp. NBU794 TaxID=3422590 RepID=UPI003D6FC33B
MYKTVDLSRLPVLASHADVALFDLHPDVIFILDLDVHAFWWANAAGVAFWGLDNVQQVIEKDMSGDTASARRRMQQTFEKALRFSGLPGVSSIKLQVRMQIHIWAVPGRVVQHFPDFRFIEAMDVAAV